MRFSFNIKNILKFKPRGRLRIWLICAFFILMTVLFGVIDHTATYDKVSEEINTTLADAGIPDFLRLPGGKDYSLGLDLVGGIRLVYDMDVDRLGSISEKQEAVNSLRDVIERRVNFLGVREPLVQIQGKVPEARLVVELSGIDNPEEAIEEIGKTPLLEFKELRQGEGSDEYFEQVAVKYNKVAKEQQESEVQEVVVKTGPQKEDGSVEISEISDVNNTEEDDPIQDTEEDIQDVEKDKNDEAIENSKVATEEVEEEKETTEDIKEGEEENIEITGEQVKNLCLSPGQESNINAVVLRYALQQEDGDNYEDPCFVSSELDGRYLDKAEIRISSIGIIDIVLNFNKKGGELFAEITEKNTNKPLAIFLDDRLINSPNIQEKISGGVATITGSFTLDSARDLVSNLNSGALPVPIDIISQQQIGPTLGKKSVDGSMSAGMFGIIAVFIFMVLVYRLSGIIAVLSLTFYISMLLFVVKMFSITLTLAGIAGIILSIGMAVDANVLVFERLREELKEKGKDVPLRRLIDNAFKRTWSAVLDGNLSTIITATILYVFSTSFIKGFAITLGIGVILSMFSAMVVTRYLMYLFSTPFFARKKWLWSRMLKYDN